ncbi:MAG: CoA-binding protein, partial [Candidatus Bathyarchaeia archaeon]
MMLRDLLAPRSIAVIGASRNPTKVGSLILGNLISYGFKGPIYPVNPSSEEIMGLRSYPSVLGIQDVVEVAIVAVPTPLVLQVAEECGRKGVK